MNSIFASPKNGGGLVNLPMDPGGGLIHVLPGSGSFMFFSPPQEQAFYAMGLKEFRWAFERLPLGTGGPQFWRLQTHVDPLGNNSLSQR